jgi:hypothetical protein
MTFAVFAAHVFSNTTDNPPEIFRVESKDIADRIADKLRKERFTDSSGGKSRRLRRYSAVIVQEISKVAPTP